MSNTDGFSYKDLPRPHVFLQWKGTDACFDFHCKCGAHCHFDGFFAYFVKCPHCSAVYEMPFMLFPREVEEIKIGPDRTRPEMLQRDEDFDEAAGQTK